MVLKAIWFDQHGGPEVLRFGEIDTPQPGPGEVLIRLRVAALNHLDIWVRQGWPGLKLTYPHIPGADGAGEIAALGEGVTDLELGRREVINANLSCGHCEYCRSGRENLCQEWQLLGETVRGTYAEQIVVPHTNVLPLPDSVDDHTAAAAGLVFHTAWHSLIRRGDLQPGESVLIVGASGGVNTASIQIAKHIGAKVFVVGSNAEKIALAESLGADVCIDRSKVDDWSKAVYQATDRQGVDLVVDNVGAASMPLSLRSARKGGRILTVGSTSGPQLEIDNRMIFLKHISILGSTMGTQRDFKEVMQLVFAGKLKPALDRQFRLEEAAAAQARLEAGEQMGKITLVI
jgi:NADPH:quinone reductase-like Zn-dependent oxidoreductase